MVEGFENSNLIDDSLSHQYSWDNKILSPDTSSTAPHILRSSIPPPPSSSSSSIPATTTTVILTPASYTTDPTLEQPDFDTLLFPMNAFRSQHQRQMNSLDNMSMTLEHLMQHRSFFEPSWSGTPSDVSDGTQQQRGGQFLQQQQQQQQYPTLLPSSSTTITIPAARYNSTPPHQEPLIPNHHNFTPHATDFDHHHHHNNTFGQDPTRNTTLGGGGIVDNTSSSSSWMKLNNYSSSSISCNSDHFNTTAYSHPHSHHYHHHLTATGTVGSSGASVPSTASTGYYPSPPSNTTHDKHLSQFYSHDDLFLASSNGNGGGNNLYGGLEGVGGLSPPSKRARPSPLFIERQLSSTSLNSNLHDHHSSSLSLGYDYSNIEQDQAQPRMPNGVNKNNNNLFPPLQAHHQQGQQYDHPEYRRSLRSIQHRQSASFSSTSSSSSSPLQQEQEQQVARSRTSRQRQAAPNNNNNNNGRGATKTRNKARNHHTRETNQSVQTLPAQSLSNGIDPEHTNDDHRPHHCVECNKGFNRQQDLKRHKKSVHEKQFIHKCDLCHRSFSRRDSLIRHRKKCRDDSSFSKSPPNDMDNHSISGISNNSSGSQNCLQNHQNSINRSPPHLQQQQQRRNIGRPSIVSTSSSTTTKHPVAIMSNHHSLIYNN